MFTFNASSSSKSADSRKQGQSSKLSVMLGLAGLAAASIAPVVGAAITVTYPQANSNFHTHQAHYGSLTSTLVPDPVANANEFFLLNGVSQKARDELAGGDTAFAGWTFDYTTKWQNTATGNLTIDLYMARALGNAFGGAALQARYNKGANDPNMNLQWIQLVKPIGIPFDPDQIFNIHTGATVSNGTIPAANGEFIDPWPNDGTDGGPFYWHSGEIAGYTNSADNFGNFSLKFSDRPATALPPGVPKTGMLFELYLVNWDGRNQGRVEFLDGIQWGYELVPTPGTTALAAMGGVLVARRRRR